MRKKPKPLKSAYRTNKSIGKFSSAGVMFKFMDNGLQGPLLLNNSSNKKSFNYSSFQENVSSFRGTFLNYLNNNNNEFEENKSQSKTYNNLPYKLDDQDAI